MKVKSTLIVFFVISIFLSYFTNVKAQTTQKAIRINCGSFKAFSVDTITFLGDQYFAGQFAYTNFTVPDIKGTTYDTLYRSERGPDSNMTNFQYSIPIDSGTYSVYLHFAEIYWGVPGGDSTGGVGSRIFSVFIEGNEVLRDYDIYKDVGPATAVVKSFQATVTDDTLNIKFVPTVNRGKISAIEVIPPGDVPLWVDSKQIKIGNPDNYSLKQNFPNPFNPTTNIQFSIPKAGPVKLTVFNIIGQTIEELINEYKDAGTYNVKFSANDLPSGIYFYKLETSGFNEIKKMLLLK